MKPSKLLRRLDSGSLHNVRFADMRRLVRAFGFRLARISGSHHLFVHRDLAEVVNLQDVRGEAKPYQIRQFLAVVQFHDLELERDQ